MSNKYMQIALNNAKKTDTDIPVCALIVKDGEIIALENNKKEKENIATAHAEILAIESACRKLKNWRLENCEMYVTLEPCPMCAWAVISARIKKIYFGSYDLNYGAFGSKINLAALNNSKIEIHGGIEELKCNELLNEYFTKLRK